MKAGTKTRSMALGGVAGWLIAALRNRFQKGGRRQPRLELLERIALAPRHSLALVEAEGRRFLVATSPEGAPAFYALDARMRLVEGRNNASERPTARLAARVSW
ncbi:MAG: flagellar biosynthetic protein FliO [Terracidiphilus sp.]